jgi:transposase
VQFKELTDRQWDYLRLFIPPQSKVGRKRADDRKTINGILFVLITGCSWRDMPRRYGAPVTAWRRVRRWSEEGVWDRIVEALRDAAYQQGSLSLAVVSVDSSLVETKRGERIQPTTGTRSGEESRSTPQ